MARLTALILLLCSCLAAQSPRVGVIEIFGTRKIPQEKIRKALGFVEGDPLPTSRGDLEEQILAVDGVVRAAVEAVCCDDRKAILYIGIEERGGVPFEYHSLPTAEIKVPEEVQDEWLHFITAVESAARRGSVAEDLTNGHSLMADPQVRSAQMKFIDIAEQHYDLLREILRKSIDEQQRGIAAYILGYSSKKKEVVADLQYAMRDQDPTVRNNAMRGLIALMVLSRLKPELELKVSPTWFVELLNSVHFSDRTKAAEALYNFTEQPDPGTLSQLRERSLPSLLEMAKWRRLEHALPSFYLLGRIAGLPETEIQELWTQGKREALFEQFKNSKGK
jgi:hypothetical protein